MNPAHYTCQHGIFLCNCDLCIALVLAERTVEIWPNGLSKCTDTERLDFVQEHGLEYNGDGDFSAWVKDDTYFMTNQGFDLRYVIDQAIHKYRKENP